MQFSCFPSPVPNSKCEPRWLLVWHGWGVEWMYIHRDNFWWVSRTPFRLWFSIGFWRMSYLRWNAWSRSGCRVIILIRSTTYCIRFLSRSCHHRFQFGVCKMRLRFTQQNIPMLIGVRGGGIYQEYARLKDLFARLKQILNRMLNTVTFDTILEYTNFNCNSATILARCFIILTMTEGF